MKKCVLQDWVLELSFMQQSVLIAAVRGPDGLRKDHPTKLLCRWLRRCFLVSAFDGKALEDPMYPGGGSFTGPSVAGGDINFNVVSQARSWDVPVWYVVMIDRVKDYLRHVDEMPHHFQLHFMHAAEILGYKHHNFVIRKFWHQVYLMIVNDAHLRPESEGVMDARLGDTEKDWRAAEVVTALPPGPAWMDKVDRDEEYVTIDEWNGNFEICGHRKDKPHQYDGITGYRDMSSAFEEVKRRWKTVRIISASNTRMELGVRL